MKNKNLGLSFKDLSKKYQLIITTTLLLVIVSIGLAVMLPMFVTNLLLSDFKKNKETIATIAVDNLWGLLSFGNNPDVSDIENAIEAIINLDEMTHLLIYNDKETRIYKKVNENTKLQVQLYRPQKNRFSYEEDNPKLYVINVKIEKEEIDYGNITIVFSLDEVYENIKSIRIDIILVCGAILNISLILLIFISDLISKPLKTMLVTFNKIANGELSERVHITSNDEFGQLAHSFNKMVDNLEDSYYELAEVNKNMEVKVQERTLELSQQVDIRAQAEEKLKEANKVVQSIINTSPLPIIRLGTDFKVKTASPAMKTIFFFETYEIIDRENIPFIHEKEIFINRLKENIAQYQTDKFTIKGRRKNGQLLDLQIASVAQYSEAEEHIGYIVVIDDITDRLLAEKSLKESEVKYRSLIEYSIVGIAILKEKYFTFVNSSLLNIWGYPESREFLSTSFIEMVHPNHRQKIVELYELVEMYGTRDLDSDMEVELPVLEIGIICYDGREKYVELASNILNFDNDLYLQITFLDITTRKDAEKRILLINEELEQRVAEQTYQLKQTIVDLQNEKQQSAKLIEEIRFKSEILELTTSVCIVWDTNGSCKYVSPWSSKVLGWSEDKLLGDGIWERTKPVTVEGEILGKDRIRNIIAKQAVSNTYYTLKMTTSTDEIKYLKFMDSPGLQNTLITAGTEITEQVHGQQRLREMSDQLAKSLNSEKELSELKTKFISMVSHEFRTPLTVIMSCTSIIQQAIERARADIATQYLDKISKSVKIMTDLMEDVLTIGKADSKVIGDLEEVDFVSFVKFSMEDIQESYNFTCNAMLVINKEVTNFYSDEKVLNHIVHNLITNALKYTTNGEDVVITIDEADNNVIFRVADKGIGIPDEDLDNLFDNFHRARNVGSIAGTGLGLHIVKKSVDNLLGKIEVISKVNEGSTFTVTLPKDIRNKVDRSAIN